MILAVIDPGITGALSIFISGQPKYIYDMPTILRGTKKLVDVKKVKEIFEQHEVQICVIEQVGASPQMGPSSAFNFGRTAGALEGICVGVGIEVKFITPQKWKGCHSLLKKPKKAACKRAAELYPEVADWFTGPKGGPLTDRADCVLIGNTYLKFLR